MIGLIVDGEGDYAAFRARYKGKARVVKADGPRGHLVSEKSLIDSAKRQIQLLRDFGCSSIAIITDFEGRSGSSDSFRKAFERYAKSVSYASGVLLFVADRMIENWYLADVAYLSSQKKYLKIIKKQKCYESTDGKIELKKLFVPGFDYSEIKHGAELFPLVRADDAEKYSSSFKHFRAVMALD